MCLSDFTSKSTSVQHCRQAARPAEAAGNIFSYPLQSSLLASGILDCAPDAVDHPPVLGMDLLAAALCPLVRGARLQHRKVWPSTNQCFFSFLVLIHWPFDRGVMAPGTRGAAAAPEGSCQPYTCYKMAARCYRCIFDVSLLSLNVSPLCLHCVVIIFFVDVLESIGVFGHYAQILYRLMYCRSLDQFTVPIQFAKFA